MAAILGLVATGLGDSVPPLLNTTRLFLVFFGLVTAGAAVSMRPELWWSWGLAAATAGVGVGGLPGHWDSFRLFLGVLAGVFAAGAGFCLLSRPWAMGIASVLLLYHFSGIFMATTSPPPAPWLTDQFFGRIFNPYLQFVYLRNAYHFYSPEPGPASILAFLIKTEVVDPQTGKTSYKTRWVVLPRRPVNVRDPLGLGYYRLLSLTEQAAQGTAGLVVPVDYIEKTEVQVRREGQQMAIPYQPDEAKVFQYKLPRPDVTRYVLPSYASHVILEYVSKEDAARTTVKIYRLEHAAMTADRFAAGDEPFHPIRYRPYFLGEFDAYGKLRDPQEELLYWRLPIIQLKPIKGDPGNPFNKDYYDYMSVHALEMKAQDVLMADENAGRVFNWSQLR